MHKLLKYILILSEVCSASLLAAQSVKKIVLIAGVKTHSPGEHEYVKTVRMLKVMLDNAPNLHGVKTEIHYNGWPTDPATLNDADVIVVYADGSDDKEEYDPIFAGDHFGIIEKQMKRGCGLVLLHFSTFAPIKYSSQFFDWVGGYFDYQGGKPDSSGHPTWYSAIKTETAKVIPVSAHEVARGLSPFDLHEEFYYKIHFMENDKRVRPVLKVSISGVKDEQVIAWTTDRVNAGRGFGFTGGHFYNNLSLPGYRKLILNAIVWVAHAEVPKDGVESRFYSDNEVEFTLNK